MEIYHVYTKLRKEYGRNCNFVDEPASVVADLRPDDALHAEEFIERDPCTTIVQVAPEMSENSANTQQITSNNKGMSHTEGGWPKDVDFTEVEHVIRYRKKVEKDGDYISSIAKLGSDVEDLIKQNNAIDIYEEYFSGAIVDHSSEAPYAKTLTTFVDPSPAHLRRSASYMSWYPDAGGSRKCAIAYSVLAFQEQPEAMPVSSYIWDVNNPSTPDFEIRPHSQLCCLNYNPKDPNVLAGGSYNGQISYWDTRKGSLPVDSSPIEKSHRDPCYDMAWLQSKTGTECTSVSTDGNVFWWDTRRLGEPVESLVLKEKGKEKVLGAVSMEYEAVAGPTKFMIGCEDGTVLNCNRKAKTPADRVTGSYHGHHGPVYSLERNPFYPKYFLSIGDWTARVWMEDLKTPIMTTKYHNTYLTGGTWSPTRPGVFFTIKMDGVLDIWDFFFKQNDPSLQVGICDKPLTSFNIQDGGKLVTCGAVDGSATLLELCDGLATMQQNEKQSINQMFERETKREKNLETRAKELKLQAKKNMQKEMVAETDYSDVLRQVEENFDEATKDAGDYDDTNPLDFTENEEQ